MKRITLILLMFAFGLSACRSATPTAGPANVQDTPMPTANLSQTPEPGKATAIGRVMTLGGSEPYGNVIVRLAEVIDFGNDEDDTFALDEANSPGAVSDANGYFVFPNIEPGEYVLIFGNVATIYVIPTSEPDKATVVNLPADQITDMGEIPIQFPQ